MVQEVLKGETLCKRRAHDAANSFHVNRTKFWSVSSLKWSLLVIGVILQGSPCGTFSKGLGH